MSFTIRPLRPDEAPVYREIRLEALRLHPDAFGAAFEQEAKEPLAWFATRLTNNTVFAGLQDQTVLGTAGFMPEHGMKRAHKAHFWGMYVRREARGSGLSRDLVAAVVEYAQPRVQQLHLSVVAGNLTAQRLYRSFGFEPYGTEPRSLKVDGVYIDEVLMAKILY